MAKVVGKLRLADSLQRVVNDNMLNGFHSVMMSFLVFGLYNLV
jgi:hypothetical protein